ncbi:MAG TPA: sulfite exporter TauE/SafE family protein [Kofleriaceae bacterium]
MDTAHLALVGAAAAAGGAVNAIAGGGSLLTFPALLACGVPAVVASATNTVAMCPGYLGATWAQRAELAGQGGRIAKLVPISAAGGAAGALLLLHTNARTFDVVVPFLLLVAVVLLGFQDRIRARLHAVANSTGLAALISGLAAIYGGYFGAGLGVIILAALAIVLPDSLTRLNALKQLISLAVNVTAALVFLAIGDLDRETLVIMAGASLVGGVVGGAIASRVSAKVLRACVVAIGGAVALVYFVRLFRQF